MWEKLVNKYVNLNVKIAFDIRTLSRQGSSLHRKLLIVTSKRKGEASISIFCNYRIIRYIGIKNQFGLGSSKLTSLQVEKCQ